MMNFWLYLLIDVHKVMLITDGNYHTHTHNSHQNGYLNIQVANYLIKAMDN